ncbi:uncharacterized protein LOC141737456 [Larus michahellis]|uniref:uncharacterized protein LOC141737456 n=1 Tax=Larus michahellis TaxID=119627 RepID=UPI003D9BABCA
MDSMTDRGYSSFSSLYSFPEPRPGAMAELAALDRSGPRHPPRAVKGRVEEPGPALCQEPPLELPTRTKQEPVPRESRDRVQSPVDTQPSPCSPPAMASDQGELVMELLRCFECTQEMARQCCEMLKVLQARWQGAAGACDWNLPREPFHPLGRMEAQQQLGATVKPQHLEAEQPWVGANMDKSQDWGHGQGEGHRTRQKCEGEGKEQPCGARQGEPGGSEEKQQDGAGREQLHGAKHQQPPRLRQEHPHGCGREEGQGAEPRECASAAQQPPSQGHGRQVALLGALGHCQDLGGGEAAARRGRGQGV